MSRPSKSLSSLRDALLAGLLVLAPIGLTIWVFLALVRFADSSIGLLPAWARPETYMGHPIPGLGILLSLLVLALVGYGTSAYAGRRAIEWIESLLARVPVLSGVYHGVKQLFENVFNPESRHFRRVVAVEYPRKGIYCFAFVTNEQGDPALRDCLPGDPQGLVSLFLPTTPNPTSGFYLLVPEQDVYETPYTVEEAFKLIMTAGIVLPSDVLGRIRTEETGRPVMGD